jgi:L-asparaginase
MPRNLKEKHWGLEKDSSTIELGIYFWDKQKISRTMSGDRRKDKNVLIIYTGGTMGMRPGADGSLAPSAGYLTERIKEMPEMSQADMPGYHIIEYDPLIDSSCMGPSHWMKIASDIEHHYDAYDGFVVIMGTDTMAYASSALSFMMENLGKTVVFTGSQIPFFEVYNDARRNFLVSTIFASTRDFPEVCVCFNDKILRANRTVKVNSVSLDAFDSPNFPPLATLGSNIVENKHLFLPKPTEPLKVHKSLDAHVVVLKLVPGFDDECVHALVEYSKTLKAIVLELYGTGNGPSNKQSLLDAIKAARAKGIVVVAVSQCMKGGVSLETYSMGREFQNAGIIAGGDMTTEACTTKLAYLIGCYDSKEAVEKLIAENIRGEITCQGDFPQKYFSHRDKR